MTVMSNAVRKYASFHLNSFDIKIIAVAMMTKIGITIYQNLRVQSDLLDGSGVIF
jgi:hypothetical protein